MVFMKIDKEQFTNMRILMFLKQYGVMLVLALVGLWVIITGVMGLAKGTQPCGVDAAGITPNFGINYNANHYDITDCTRKVGTDIYNITLKKI